ncbi:hypothetical protein OIU76_014013 [Salix suchowensis]|nr:hypothetical protein OIU76_014013 [Salix suchowensis]
MCPLPQAINPDYKPSEKLNGKVALVTGGDSGIGRSAKSSDAGDPIAIATDVSSEEDCKKVVDQVASKYGRIDILVNNAGVQHYTNLVEEITEAWLVRLFRTNIFGYFFMTKHSLKHMKEGSCIINTASVTAYSWLPSPVTRLFVYQGIDCFLHQGIGPETCGSRNSCQWCGSRAGQPYELAPSYVFLASNQCSSYMTGQVLHPNGGTIVNG